MDGFSSTNVDICFKSLALSMTSGLTFSSIRGTSISSIGVGLGPADAIAGKARLQIGRPQHAALEAYVALRMCFDPASDPDSCKADWSNCTFRISNWSPRAGLNPTAFFTTPSRSDISSAVLG